MPDYLTEAFDRAMGEPCCFEGPSFVLPYRWADAGTLVAAMRLVAPHLAVEEARSRAVVDGAVNAAAGDLGEAGSEQETVGASR